jgi:hypothetical protein
MFFFFTYGDDMVVGIESMSSLHLHVNFFKEEKTTAYYIPYTESECNIVGKIYILRGHS